MTDKNEKQTDSATGGAADDGSLIDDGGDGESSDSPSQMDNHDAETDEDTASGGPA